MNQHSSTKCPQDKVCGYEYTVRRGDSFYLIANRLGVPLRDLLEANSDVNPARLMVGDVLCIPMEEDDAPTQPTPPTETPSTPETPSATDDLDAPAAPAEPETPTDTDSTCPGGRPHTVANGETAADLLLGANINLYSLQAANPEADLSQLTPGQVLCIPTESQPCPLAATYTLQTDETLESVALRLNASLSALLHANPCLAPGDFRAGQCITVPED